MNKKIKIYHTLLITCLCFWLSQGLQLNAQYFKLPLDTNHYWQQRVTIMNIPGQVVHCDYFLKVVKDSVVNGKVFKYVTSLSVNCNTMLPHPFGDGGLLWQDTIAKIVTVFRYGKEHILYNFNKDVGDTATLRNSNTSSSVYSLIAKDSVFLNDGLYHKRFSYYDSVQHNLQTVIEGVGYLRGLLTPWQPFEVIYKLNCLSRISPSVSIYNASGVLCPSLTSGILSNSSDAEGITIFPSPASESMTVYSENSPLDRIEIKNTLGQTIINLQEIRLQSIKINVANFQNGIYVVRVYYGNKSVTQRFVKN